MINVTIDGKTVQVEEGITVLKACEIANVNVPTLCYLEGVNQIGACRLCLVEIEGVRGLNTACTFPVNDGMVVRTNTKQVREARKSTISQAVSSFTPWEKALYENLRNLRKLLANRSRMPAYTIFSDVTLQDMVKKRPQDLDAFLDVSGVGANKQRIYGEAFLAVIRDGAEPNDAILLMEAPNEP